MNLQEVLEIELPIIQATMAGVQGSALAVAVCNSGGLGSLPCAMLSPDAMRKELAAITKPNPRIPLTIQPALGRPRTFSDLFSMYVREVARPALAVRTGSLKAMCIATRSWTPGWLDWDGLDELPRPHPQSPGARCPQIQLLNAWAPLV